MQTVEAHKEPFMRVVEENVSSMTSMSPMNVHYRILVDKETGVMYYAEYADGYRAGGAAITPLYNADGTLRIYKGEDQRRVVLLDGAFLLVFGGG